MTYTFSLLRVVRWIILVSLLAFQSRASAERQVSVARLPSEGMKPSAAVDAVGRLHIAYFAGSLESGDAFYIHSTDGGATFSTPLRVNSQAGSVVGFGSHRGPKLALSANGTVHVAWNGSATAEPKAPRNPAQAAESPFNGTPVLYARLPAGSVGFEEQRNLMVKSCALDGGCGIATDEKSNVFITWHASDPLKAAPDGGGMGEESRTLWIARSADDGVTFAPETQVPGLGLGACGCCGVDAIAFAGNLHILFRSAETSMRRNTYLVSSDDFGKTFRSHRVDDWEVVGCPGSINKLLLTASGLLGAWETKDRVFWGRLGLGNDKPVPVPYSGQSQAEQTLAVTKSGDLLVAWGEGTGWDRGGSVAWQIFDGTGAPVGKSQQQKGLPPHGAIAAVATPTGDFVILY